MKPFSLQAPEEVAKTYGGNKQKIMAAAQTGVVDPTAAVLAGMFIDRMRNAAQAEQANPPTVAQQVMGGVPPQGAPPMGGPPPGGPPPGAPQGGPPPAPTGGLGATPEAQGMPPPGGPPPGAPPGMAKGGGVSPEKVENAQRAIDYLTAPPEGGLDAIPVNDGMFEPGMAGGGIVAFAGGGVPDYRSQARQMLPSIIQVETGGRPRPGQPTPYGTAQGIAQMLPSTARGVAKKLGLPFDERKLTGTDPDSVNYQKELATGYLTEALEASGGDPDAAAAYYHGGPNKKLHGPKTRDYVSKFRGVSGEQGATGEEDYQPRDEVDTDTREGRQVSLDDLRANQKGWLDSLPSERRKQLAAALDADADPGKRKKQRSSDLWARLAEFGANLASTDGPLLAAAGKAAKEPLAGIQEDAKARKTGERDDLKTQVALENAEREDAFKAEDLVQKNYGSELSVEGAQKELESKEAQAALDRQNRLDSITLQNKGQLDQIQAQIRGEIAKAQATNAGKDLDIAGITYTNIRAALHQRKAQGLLVGPRGQPITDIEVDALASKEAQKAMHPQPAGGGLIPGMEGQGGGGGGGYGMGVGAPRGGGGGAASPGAIHLGSI